MEARRHPAPSATSGRGLVTGRRSILVALIFLSTLAFAASLYVAADARLLSGTDAPAPATPTRTLLLRMAAALAVLAGLISHGRQSRRINRTAKLGVLGLAVVIVLILVGWAQIPPWGAVQNAIVGALVVLVSASAWSQVSGRAFWVCFSPLLGLVALSIVTFAQDGNYLFPWYNTWGLVAVIAIGALVVHRLGRSVTALLVVLLLAAVVLSTSRQALVGLALIGLVLIIHAPRLGSRLRFIAVLAGAGSIAYYVLSTNERLTDLGSVTADNGRSALFASAMDFISEHPFLGVSGSLSSGYDTGLAAVGLGWSTSVHNLVLDAWVRAGIVAALMAVLLLVGVCLTRSADGRRALSPIGVGALPFMLLGSQLLYLDSVEGSSTWA